MPSPQDQAAWEQYLFERHSRARLAAWAPTLRFFRYWRAVGGLAGGDADELLVALRAETRAEVEQVLGTLGVPVTVLDPSAPRRVPGRSYTPAEWAALPEPVDGMEELEQPGHVTLAGTRAFVWVRPGRIELSVLDPDQPYDITDRAIAAARWIEPALAPLAALVIDPPRPGEHCVSPARYPELFVGSER